MRLTLRTMLAYLDRILDPKDAQDIEKKIEDSEYATGLLHRIRDVVRRMRLAAPSLADRTGGLDANHVAEYLDNTLPSDAVTDFEKVCLESDVHLAEVASCHQILTLVLGEPAEIDPASRQKMYEVKEGGDARRAVEPTSAPIDHPPPTPVRESGVPLLNMVTTLDLNDEGDEGPSRRRPRTKPTVPEYLREPRTPRRWLPVAAAVVLIAVVTLALLQTLGQFEVGTPLGNTLANWGLIKTPAPTGVATTLQPSTMDGKSDGKSDATPGSSIKPEEPKDQAATEPSSQQSPIDAAQAPATPPTHGAATPAEPTKARAQVDEPSAETSTATSKEAPKPADATKEVPTEPTKTATTKAPEASIVVKPDGPINLPPPPGSEETVPADGGRSKGETAAKAAPTAETAKPTQEATESKTTEPPAAHAASTLPPEPIGRLVTIDQVLLKDDGAGGWRRVGASPTLTPGRYLALPTYRPKITLTAGVTLEVLGGTLFELVPSNHQTPTGVRIVYGRIGMLPLSQPDSRVSVTFGERSGVVTFGDVDSVAAFDIRRLRPPGTNPEEEPPHIIADLYCATGNITWTETGTAPLRLDAPHWVSFSGSQTSAPATSRDLPHWLIEEPVQPLERRASIAIAQPTAMPTDRLARLALMELSTSRPQREVRMLALRCLTYIDQFDDIVKALNDPARKLDWVDYVDVMHDAVARDSQSAAAVRRAMEQHYPDQAATLYRMLWGYSNKDLEGGEDAKLVRDMNDDVLAVRRLSFWNLKDLTGIGVYQPEQTALKRQPALRSWQRRLDAHEIRVKMPEEKAANDKQEGNAPPTVPAVP